MEEKINCHVFVAIIVIRSSGQLHRRRSQNYGHSMACKFPFNLHGNKSLVLTIFVTEGAVGRIDEAYESFGCKLSR